MSTTAITLHLTVNGIAHTVEIEPHETLLELLRDRLGLTGPKKCCGEGECGACTVILNGKSVNSCIILAAETEGAQVTTIEGLSHDGQLAIIQEAFLDAGAVQCGFCTPGMIMEAHYLLSIHPSPSDEEIQTAMEGNLCRCTGYKAIREAINIAVKRGYQA
jgi:carbon-monoxide dehydrogenase small subunit